MTETTWLFSGAKVFDGETVQYRDADVLVRGGLIEEVEPRIRVSDASVIACRGRALLPGLIDAHFHAYTPSFNVARIERMPWVLLGAHAARILRGALARGFTTVRDAAGGDHALAQALDQGLMSGPRLFYPGRALSQTGGHGDFRDGLALPYCCSGIPHLTRIVDGEDAVRAAAREELRLGAHHLKIFASGGVLSPHDPIWMRQFTDAEIAAAVDEARSRHTYVMAHSHTIEATQRCVRLGVRTIEHGTQLDAETAQLMAQQGVFHVPTIVAADVVQRHGAELDIPAASLEKVAAMTESALRSVEISARAGVKIGFGTDLMGCYHHEQNREFLLRREVQASAQVLLSCTRTNAEIIQQSETLGCIRAGAYADLLVVDGDPLADISVLADPEPNIRLIMKAGQIYKNSLI